MRLTRLSTHRSLHSGFGFAALSAVLALAALSWLPAQGRFQLTSSDFTNHGQLPIAHTCDGAGTSAPLAWSGAPAGTQSFALVMFDPDARPPRGFVHWVAYDIPASVTSLASGKYNQEKLPHGGVNGNNGSGQLGFVPSCPPAGGPHHYTFTLYALRVGSLRLAPGATREELLHAMQGKILARTKLVGLYTGHARSR